MTKIDILLDYSVTYLHAEESFLQLHAIRPIRLKFAGVSGIPTQLLRRVAQDFSGTVEDLSINGLRTGSALALYDAFSAFRNNGRLLTHLLLDSIDPMRSVLFAASSLISLVRLELALSTWSFPGWEDGRYTSD